MSEVIKERGDEYPQKIVKSLQQVSPELLEKIAEFRIETKDKELLVCTVQMVDFTRHPSVNLPLAYAGGQRYYFLVKNQRDEVIAVRSLNVFDERARFLATSHIYIHSSYRGKGLAGPVDDQMVKLLQKIANQKKKKVFWRVENENIATLNEYKARPDADPAIVAQRELEQERWMKLYGPEGKFPKRTFEPETTVEDVGGAIHAQIEGLL
jgi:GNAT superfamily N-acetyltransferase